MTVTDELVKSNEAYASAFTKGELPTPPAKKAAVLACMDARLDPARILGLEEAFGDPDADVNQTAARIKASPFIARKDKIRGFVYEVESGRLREVAL